ncbi:MAG: carboxypeptidase regulatory-like domain-containing protein [Thermoplasmata archaeon]|nr:MAG: carboxypeptidase regulatory-like domain-containing protein [Thermoplasmata archaeon]
MSVPRPMAVLALLAGLTLTVVLISAGAEAQDGFGLLSGEVTIVGDDPITDGEVVVSFAGTNTSAATATFSSDDPSFEIELNGGDYTVYAWAKVYHNSARQAFTITGGGTTWVNLTVVRIEEIIGTVKDPDGEAVPGAVLQFRSEGTIVGTSTTDDLGQFRDLLEPGTYSLHITKAGFHELERNVTIAPGQVLFIDMVMDPVPPEEEDEDSQLITVLTVLFIFLAMGISFGYMMRQTRKIRRAAAEAETARTKDMECPQCGSRVPGGSGNCPECSYVFQVRCDECGRSVDAGTEQCPECGHELL